jgi:hypothetical protein
MGSRIYHPPLGQKREAVEIRVGGARIYTFQPGVPLFVPKEDDAAVVAALAALQGNLAVSPAPSLVVTGGAAGAQSYKAVAYNATSDGVPSAATATAVGPTTLDGTHYIDVTVAAAPNADAIKIIRFAGGVAQGLIGTVPAGGGTLRDNGLVATVYSPSGANPALVAAIAGPAEI